MDFTSFIDSMYETFAPAEKPDWNDMTPHRCCECDKVREDLYSYSNQDVPDALVDYHGDSLPFLSPNAFRYYLPRYIEFSLLHPEHQAYDNILFMLGYAIPQEETLEKVSVFTSDERQFLVNYLHLRQTLPDAQYEEDELEAALEFWSKMGDGSLNADR